MGRSVGRTQQIVVELDRIVSVYYFTILCASHSVPFTARWKVRWNCVRALRDVRACWLLECHGTLSCAIAQTEPVFLKQCLLFLPIMYTNIKI